MMMTMEISEELATRLSPVKSELPQIIELGLREFNMQNPHNFEGMSDTLDFLANLPAPEEVLKLRPSSRLQARISRLLEKNRAEGLSDTEEKEWVHYEYLEHLVRMAKARAERKLFVP